MITAFGDNPLFSLLSERTIENLANAFTTPFFIICVGALTAPAYKTQTAVALAVIVALVLGGFYVFSFTGGSMFGGWDSLYYGATPVLNLAGIATALYTIWRRYQPNESQ
jgi:hypothetical protein